MLLFILAFIIPSVFAYTESDCNCETLLGFDGCEWKDELNTQTGITGRVECNNAVITTNLENADLRGAVFNDVSFADGFRYGQIGNAVDVVNVDFRGASFTNVDFYHLTEVDFKFATFSETESVKLHGSVSDTDFAYVTGDIRVENSNLPWLSGNNVVGTNVNIYKSGKVSVSLREMVSQINAAYDAGAASVKASETELAAAYKELKNC